MAKIERTYRARYINTTPDEELPNWVRMVDDWEDFQVNGGGRMAPHPRNVLTIDARIVKIAKEYGYKSQALMMIEEMSELTKAICKLDRKRSQLEKGGAIPEITKKCGEACEDIMDEIADVWIMLIQMRYFMHLSDDDFKERLEGKIERQIKRIEEET